MPKRTKNTAVCVHAQRATIRCETAVLRRRPETLPSVRPKLKVKLQPYRGIEGVRARLHKGVRLEREADNGEDHGREETQCQRDSCPLVPAR